jgi:hypothetical protein
MLPLLPVMMENCAECTYPVGEDVSMGLMFAASNILGLGFIFALQYLIEEPAFGPPPFLPSNLFIIGTYCYLCAINTVKLTTHTSSMWPSFSVFTLV